MTSSTSPPSCARAGPARLGDAPVLAWWSGREAGDQRALGVGTDPPAPVPPGLDVRRVRQVHGGTVVVVGPEPPATGPEPPRGDALASAAPGLVLVVLTADCAPIALAGADGAFAAVHAGWRGLMAGVVARGALAVGALGAGPLVAGLGPTIGPCCYEFSPAELDEVAGAFGHGVRAESTRGRPSLDLRAAVAVALARQGVELVVDCSECTGCSSGYFSHRARGDEGRQALFVWRAPAEP